MEEEFTFYVVTERAIPEAMFDASTPERMRAIAVALEAAGSVVGRLRTSIEGFARAFERIGEATGVGDLFAQGAIAASPHDLLDDDDESWRMGYFGAETAAIIDEELPVHRAELDALSRDAPPTAMVRDLFLAAVAEAAASGQCIVIVHAGA